MNVIFLTMHCTNTKYKIHKIQNTKTTINKHRSVMNELGIIINDKLEGAFDSLYAMALEMPIPDFTAVYDLVCKNSLFENEKLNIKNDSENMLKWQLLDIKGIKLRFADVLCYKARNVISDNDELEINEEKQKQLLSGVTDDQREWTDVDLSQTASMGSISMQDGNRNDSCLRQMGALLSGRSFYSYGDMIPVSLYGPIMKNMIHIKGRIEVPIFNDQQKEEDDEKNTNESEIPQVIIMHEEEWKLKKDESNDSVFNGEYVIRQRPIIPKIDPQNQDNEPTQEIIEQQNAILEKFAPMDWVYDLQMEFK